MERFSFHKIRKQAIHRLCRESMAACTGGSAVQVIARVLRHTSTSITEQYVGRASQRCCQANAIREFIANYQLDSVACEVSDDVSRRLRSAMKTRPNFYKAVPADLEYWLEVIPRWNSAVSDFTDSSDEEPVPAPPGLLRQQHDLNRCDALASHLNALEQQLRD